MKKFWAYIPARSGSTGLKNKNIIKYKGLPLIAHSILICKKIKKIEKIFVSTDSRKYLKISEKHGASKNNYLRPKKYSGKLSEDKDSVLHFFKKIKKKDWPYAVILLRPTTPLRRVSFMKKAIKIFEKLKNYDSLCSIESVDDCPQKFVNITNKSLKGIVGKKSIDEINKPRQIYKTCFKRNSHIEIFKTSNLIKYKNIYGKKSYPFFDKVKNIDIDYRKDLKK